MQRTRIIVYNIRTRNNNGKEELATPVQDPLLCTFLVHISLDNNTKMLGYR